jgi:hypothetical protein
MDTAKLRALKEINKMVTLPTRQTEFMSFTKARSLVRTQRLISVIEFKAWKRPMGMPSNPRSVYKTLGWISWGDFLGTRNTSPQTEFMSFAKARTLAQAQHFTSQVVFHAWKKPMGMPSQPRSVYKTLGWINWFDFLGKKRRIQ